MKSLWSPYEVPMRFLWSTYGDRWQPKGKPWANERITKYNSIVLGLKVIKQKVSFIKIRPIYMLLTKPKIGAKLILFYETRKFYTRAHTHIIKVWYVFHKIWHIQTPNCQLQIAKHPHINKQHRANALCRLILWTIYYNLVPNISYTWLPRMI